MVWRYESKQIGVFEVDGKEIQEFGDFLVNDEGVEIRANVSRDGWNFIYTDGNVSFRFTAMSTSFKDDLAVGEPRPLGPVCYISPRMLGGLSDKQRREIAENLVEAMLAHHLLPRAIAPYAEEACFSRWTIQRYHWPQKYTCQS